MSADPKEALAYNPHLSIGTDLRDMFAGLAMQAHIQAAWSCPSVSNTAYESWKGHQPPGEPCEYIAWIACRAYAQADAMLARREETSS